MKKTSFSAHVAFLVYFGLTSLLYWHFDSWIESLYSGVITNKLLIAGISVGNYLVSSVATLLGVALTIGLLLRMVFTFHDFQRG